MKWFNFRTKRDTGINADYKIVFRKEAKLGTSYGEVRNRPGEKSAVFFTHAPICSHMQCCILGTIANTISSSRGR